MFYGHGAEGDERRRRDGKAKARRRMKATTRTKGERAPIRPAGPSMRVARLILFTPQIDAMTSFYRDVMGLPLTTDEKGWRELDAGGITLSLHSGPASPGKKGPKLAFFARDVSAMRDALNDRGAKFGKVTAGDIQLSNGKDPDGNWLQLSNR